MNLTGLGPVHTMLRSPIFATLLFAWGLGCGLAPERLTSSALDRAKGAPGRWWSFDGDVELDAATAADPEVLASLSRAVERAELAAAAVYVHVTGPAVGACLVEQVPCPVPVRGTWSDPRLLPGLRWFDGRGRIPGEACLWFSTVPPTEPTAWSDLLAAVTPAEVAVWCQEHAGWPLWEGTGSATRVDAGTGAERTELAELPGTALMLDPEGGDPTWFAELCTAGVSRPLLGGSGVEVEEGDVMSQIAEVGSWRTSIWIPDGGTPLEAWSEGRIVVHMRGWRGRLRLYDYDGGYLGTVGDRVTIQGEREVWVLLDGEAPTSTAVVELYRVPEAGCSDDVPELLERWRPCEKGKDCRYELRYRWERPEPGRLAMRVIDVEAGTRLWSGVVSLVGGEGGILERIH